MLVVIYFFNIFNVKVNDLSYDKLVVKNGTEAIVEYANYDKMSKAVNPYGDGWACVRIVNALR